MGLGATSLLRNRFTRISDERDAFGGVGLSTSFAGGGYAIQVDCLGSELPPPTFAMPLSIRRVAGNRKYRIAPGHFESAPIAGGEFALWPGTRIWAKCQFRIQFNSYGWQKQNPEDPENDIPIQVYYPTGLLGSFGASLSSEYSPNPSGPGNSHVSSDDPELGQKISGITTQYYLLGEIRPDGSVSGGGGGPGLRVNSNFALSWG